MNTNSTPSHLPRRRFAILRRLAPLFLLAFILQPLIGAPSPAAAQSAGLPENVLDASVRIMTDILVTPDDPDEEPFLCMLDEHTVLDISVGSGTIISEDGYIVTNHHVMDAGEMIPEAETFCKRQAPRRRATVEYTHVAWLPDDKGAPSEPYTVELIADTSYEEDLSLVKIDRHLDGSRVNTRRDPFPFVQFGDSDALREPEKLTVIGYPLNAGDNRRVSEGIFSGWGDNGFGVDWIYTDATISGGNSGGTAVNSSGLFIGIPTQATFSDCRPGDTNSDGVIDDKDTGCIGLGGNYGILIPSNIVRAFVEDATGDAFPVAESVTPPDDETPVPTPDETAEPANTDGPPVGEISFSALDDQGDEIDTFQNVGTIQACFDNNWVVDGQELVATWYLDDAELFSDTYTWDDAWNPTACASLFVDEGEDDPYLDPGTYRIEITVGDETVVSDDLVVTTATNIQDISIRARNSDRETIEADAGNVLTGEITTVYADITFTDMAEGALWQADWYLDGEVVFSSEPEAWGSSPDGEESARLRNTDRGPLDPGTYEVVITIDGVEAGRATFTIEEG